jgi:hypothetical protein
MVARSFGRCRYRYVAGSHTRRDRYVDLVQAGRANSGGARDRAPPMVRPADTIAIAEPENACPDGTLGFVGPKPTPKRTTVSPAFAATAGCG